MKRHIYRDVHGDWRGVTDERVEHPELNFGNGPLFSTRKHPWPRRMKLPRALWWWVTGR